MSELEKSLTRIRQSSNLIHKLCIIGQTLGFILIASQAVLTVSVLFLPKLVTHIVPTFENNFFLFILWKSAGLESLEPKYQASIGCFVILLMMAVTFLMIQMVKRMMKRLSDGERPFDVQTARDLRHKSLILLVFCLYNPLLVLISLALVYLFSYIMEYGACIQERADETNRIQEEIIMSFAEITENKSGQTGKHIKRVSEYSRVIAEALGMGPEKTEHIRIASTMHDVGKLMIPSEILEKPGKLTDEEFEVIKTHPAAGGQLLKNVEGEDMKLSRTIALQHHERYDGKGYPEHLQKDEISLEGRIVAVADVYDALTSKRSYKDAWKEEDAYQEILKGSGTQFDPQVVEAFSRAHDKILQIRNTFQD